MSFQTEFMVSMTCESCVESIDKTLQEIQGIERYDIDLKSKTVLVQGTASPALLARKIQETGRDAIIRGLGGREGGAAVCILEKQNTNASNMQVYGLARLVEASPSLTLCDLTVRGLPPGSYRASVRQTGDVREGARSAGDIMEGGIIGDVDVDKSGAGQALLETSNWRIADVVGRAMVLSRNSSNNSNSNSRVNDDKEQVSGVIARSAGTWENAKMVCTCSGQNVWDERRNLLSKQSTL